MAWIHTIDHTPCDTGSTLAPIAQPGDVLFCDAHDRRVTYVQGESTAVFDLVRQLAELLEGTPFQGTIANSGDTILVDVPGPTAAVDGDSTQYYLTLREIA